MPFQTPYELKFGVIATVAAPFLCGFFPIDYFKVHLY